MKTTRVFLFSLLLLLVLIFITLGFHLRLNQTASMPLGLYLKVKTPITRDSLVEVCLPKKLSQFGLARHYLRAGICPDGVEPLFKKVVGIAGDTIDVRANYVAINGTPLPHSATFLKDSDGHPLPSIVRGQQTLGAEELWLYGDKSLRSWDSRYYGAIDKRYVISVLKPIFLW